MKENGIIPKKFVSLLAATAVVDRQGYQIFCIRAATCKKRFHQ
jgi:hypothetical protein